MPRQAHNTVRTLFIRCVIAMCSNKVDACMFRPRLGHVALQTVQPATQMFPNMQIAWQVSIYLEALAILPQLTLLMRTENIDNLTGNYVFLLGAYRALYILNWIYRWATEPNYYHWLGVLPFLMLSFVYMLIADLLLNCSRSQKHGSVGLLFHLASAVC